MFVVCKFISPISQVFSTNLKKINVFFILTKFGLIPLLIFPKNKFLLVYQNLLYFLFFNFFWTYLIKLKFFFHKIYFVYRADIKLVGRGYKFFFFNQKKIEFRVGINLPIRVILSKFLTLVKLKKCRYDTQIFQIKSRNFLLLTSFVSFLRRLKIPDSYKGKGLRFRREKPKLKYRKKYGVF